MGMNEYLAELYNTAENVGSYGEEDLEKTAAAELVMDFCKEAGLDVESLDDDDIVDIYNELVSPEEEGMDKLAEADLMGRAMAHAYVDELTSIEKEAASFKGAWEGAKGAGKRLRRYAAGAAEATGVGKLSRGIKGRGALKEELSALKARSQIGDTARGHAARAAEIKRVLKARAGASQEAREGAKRLAISGGIAGGAGAGAYGVKKLMEKKQAAAEFEEMSNQRAWELLDDAGYLEEHVEKTAGFGDREIDILVEQRALEILEENGYPVE